jgi:hypothetical protein
MIDKFVLRLSPANDLSAFEILLWFTMMDTNVENVHSCCSSI